jgi:thiazolinyl imide reductase
VTRRWRVAVAGTNFGRVHAAGVLAHPDEFELVAILSRGSAPSRRYAAELGVAHCTDVGELPADVDVACVAVGSAVSGGRGAELACELLARGIAVLAEHPMHPDELAECLRTARRHRTGFRITTHYPHVAPVRTFLAAAERLRSHAAPLFVDAASPVHVLHPLLDVLGRALGGLRPWAFAEPAPVPAELATLSGGPGPLRSLNAVLAGVPLTLRVQNQLHPGDRDNHALLWHRIAIGTDAGVLTLADTHGPVLWSPRFHAARDADRRLVLDGGEHLALPSTSVIGPAETESFADVMGSLWPDAVAHALRGLREAVRAGVDPLKDGQFDLTVSRMWADLVTRLGPPESIRRPPPHPLPADTLVAASERHGRAHLASESAARPDSGMGYGASSEFFELGAAAHAAVSGAAVAAALAGVDTAHGPIVEIGAGTGLVTAAIAAALPEARILAAEPSTTLRAVLTSRVVRDPDLRARVTVVPETAQELQLPDRISAAVLCGVVGHLDEAERRALWQRLTQRLPRGAPIVVELMGFATPERMPPTRLAAAELGRLRYEWWFSADPDGGALRLRSTWRVHAGGAAVREVSEDYRWFPFGLDELARETGLSLRQVATDSAPLGVLTTS